VPRAPTASAGSSRSERLTLSGIGEPLHNHAVTTRFVEWARKQNLKSSLTTSGGPLPKLRTWLETVPHNGLTLSVHAGTEAVRKQLVPHGPALEPLFGLLASVLPTLTRKRHKKVALAYLMMDGVSAEDSELDAFAARAVPLGVAVHLFAYNPVRTSSQKPVSRARYEAAYERLRAQGLVVRMSSAARLEANGGCGTLVALSPPPRSAEQTS
jgi:23S rRNA (adenine2503-C2)-methyltransferase